MATNDSKTNIDKAVSMAQGLNKTGVITKSSPSSKMQKHAININTGMQDYYHPLFQESTLMLPTKFREINQYCRHWYLVDPMVSAAINFHSEFCINGFRNTCPDPKIKKYFDELAFDILKLPEFLSFVALEWYKLGNVAPFGTWDEKEGRWKNFITLNPDYVEIEKILFSDTPVLKLDPDEGLKRIVTNKSPRALYNQLDPTIIPYVLKGQKIPLSDLEIQTDDESFSFPQVTHLARKASQYEVYGIPMMRAAFKALIYKDLLRNTQFSIAKRHWKPIKIIKVGDDTHAATDAILADVEEAVKYADSDPNGWIVWHNYISAEYVASAGHVMPLNAEYSWVDSELMRALEISDAVLTNQGMTFANASVSVKVMVNKYLRFQKMLSSFIKNFIYKPVAQVQGFYTTDSSGNKQLVVPDIEWELMRLQDDAQIKTVLQGMETRGLISKHTVMAFMDLDYDKERALIIEEQKDADIFKPAPKPGAVTPGAPKAPAAPGGAATPGGPGGGGAPTAPAADIGGGPGGPKPMPSSVLPGGAGAPGGGGGELPPLPAP